MGEGNPFPRARGHKSRSDWNAYLDETDQWRSEQQNRVRSSQEEMRERKPLPRELVLREVVLTETHLATGATRHFRGGAELPKPGSLRIVAYEGGYRLLYLGERGEEQTDTWHQTLELAQAQAEFEFGVTPAEWTVLAEPSSQ